MAQMANNVRGFDLSIALPLAKASFAAYNTPIDEQAALNYNIKDATVSFIDKDFLQENFYGLLDVKIIRAAKLRQSDLFGTAPPDAFAVLSAQWPSLNAFTRARRLTCVAKSTDPVWDTAPFKVPVRDPASDTLRVQLYDQDVGRDEELGSAVLKLDDFVDRPEQLITLQLSGPGANPSATSTVTLSCRLRAFAQCTPADLDEVSLVDTLPPKEQPGKGAAEGVVDVFKTLGADHDGSSGKAPNYSWDDVTGALGGDATGELSPVVFLECWDTDTQVWIFRNVARRQLVVAFRGTEKVRDWLTNVQVTTDKPCDLLLGSPRPRSGGAEVQVHGGFMGAYKSVRQAANSLIATLIGGFGQPPARAWKLLVTGHSLGGALATLAAYDLAVQKLAYDQQAKSPSAVDLVLYNFGSPRVGNKAFADDLKGLLPEVWRVTNRLDIVTSVPTWQMYVHVGTAVQLGPDNRMMYNPPEVAFWEKLLSGAGVTAHLEPSYMETFFKAVQTALMDSPRPLSRL